MYVQPVAVHHGKLLLHMDDNKPDGCGNLWKCFDPQTKSFEPVMDVYEDLAYHHQESGFCHFFEQQAGKLGFHKLHVTTCKEDIMEPFKPRRHRS